MCIGHLTFRPLDTLVALYTGILADDAGGFYVKSRNLRPYLVFARDGALSMISPLFSLASMNRSVRLGTAELPEARSKDTPQEGQ
jgi:hypothetical protein